VILIVTDVYNVAHQNCYLFLKVFSNVTDTGIPALVDHVHTTTKVRRRHGIERMIRGVTHFVLDIAGYLVEVGTQVCFILVFEYFSGNKLILQLMYMLA